MKILFFSYLSHDNDIYKGGGWVNSLADLLSHTEGYEIGISYITTSSLSKKKLKNKITYYPIYRKESLFKKVYRCFLKNPDNIQVDDEVYNVIDDFSPDIIQLFGIETSVGSILRNVTNIPIVVHIQGICSGIKDKWYPMGISRLKIWWYSPLKEKLFCNTFADLHQRFVKRSCIERENFESYKYYLGRTEWDYQVSRLLSPKSQYYKCDEILRPAFYNGKWYYQERKKVIISTVLNGELYKGFDTILRTSQLLKGVDVDFEWDVYGVNEDFSLRRAIEKHVGAKFECCNVSFRGKKDADELVNLLVSSTFYVHPSHIDNSPNALCEAMLLGVPCIATYVGGIPSLINDGITGYLVPDSEFFQIAYLIKTLKDDKEKLIFISNNSHAEARQRHDKIKTLENLNRIYREIESDFRMNNIIEK